MLSLNKILKKYKFLLVLMLLIWSACKKDPPLPPSKPLLTFPVQNALCTSGTVLSTTESSIVFTWTASENTANYKIYVKNLLTGDSKMQTTTINEATFTLTRNTPYSWYVVSSNSANDQIQSEVWKFYLAGLGTTSYAPFPATISTPTYGQTISSVTMVNLTWLGNDVDNDILSYDVYFGTTTSPPLFKSNVADMFVNGVTISAGNTYYWKVITKDAQGNKSDSGVFLFKVN